MSARRHRFFDVALEDPELLKAGTKARRRGRGPTSPADDGATERASHKPAVAPAAAPTGRGRRARKAGARAVRTGRRGWGRNGSVAAEQPARTGAAGKAMRSASPMIDPRIAARRAGVEAEAAAVGARRKRRVAVMTLALVVLVGAGALVLLSPLVSVRTVEVRGATRTGSAAVRAASGLSSRPPLVRIDEERVRSRITAMPWVQRVRVERHWPHTVVLSIEERQPAVVVPCLGGGAASCLVDLSGRVLAPVTDDPRAAAALPRLAGVPAAGGPGTALPAAARGPLAVALALPAALRPLVLGVRSEGNEVALDLQAPGREATPPVVRLGSADRLADKLTAAATVLARTSVNGVAVLDVRVPESPALTRVAR